MLRFSKLCGAAHSKGILMTIVRRLQARAQRWHLLGRYYVNKWQYDGSKWAERVWYGQGSTGNGPQVASVAFMITRNMRQQLLDSGFPPSAISTLQPAVAQKIIADKITFVQFEEQQKQAVEQAAERAKHALKQEEQAKQSELDNTVHINKEEPAAGSAALVVQQEVEDDDGMKKTQS